MSESLDSFKVFKDYIKKCVLEDNLLQKLIYYPYSNCLEKDDLENPFDLFDEKTVFDSNGNGVHGILLFKRQSDIIMNAEMPLILISFEQTKKSKELSNIYIMIKIICKGTSIQELSNGDSRIYSIKSKLSDCLEGANINGLGEITENSCKEMSINSENDAILLMFKGFMFTKNLSSNKNFKKRILGENYDN